MRAMCNKVTRKRGTSSQANGPAPADQPAATPIHVLRASPHGNGRRKARPALPVVQYEAGFFTALVLQHNWPPQWRSVLNTPAVTGHSQRSCQSREAGAARGEWWAVGTITMPGTRFHAKPEWMR